MNAIVALRRLAGSAGPDDSLRIHWLHGAGAGIVLQGLSLLLAFGSGIVAARLLDPAGLGRYAYALAIASVAAVPAALGLPTAITRFIAVYRDNGEWHFARGLLRRANQVAGLMAGFLAAGMVLVAILGWQGNERWVFLFAAPLIPLLVWTRLRQTALQGLHHPVAAQLPEQILKHSGFLLLAALLWLSGTAYAHRPYGLMVVWLSASAVAFFAGAFLLYRLSPPKLRRAQPLYATREWLHTATPMLLADSVGILYATVDIIFLGALRPAAEVGLYQVAVRTAAVLLIFLTASNFVLAPWFARLHSAGNSEQLQRVVTLTTRAVFGLTLGVFVVFAIWGRELLGLFFGSAYVHAYEVLLILAAARLIDVAAGPVVNLLAMTGGQKNIAWTVAATALLNIVGCVILIPRFGMLGAAASAAVSMVAMNLVLTVAVRRHVNIASGIIGARS